jgi:hypothetical protein
MKRGQEDSSHEYRRTARYGQLGLVIGALPVMLASGGEPNVGGQNNAEKSAGNSDSGIDLQLGEIALEKQGNYFLTQRDDHVVVGDLETKRYRDIPELVHPGRVAFWEQEDKHGFYLISEQSIDGKISTDSASIESGQTFSSYNLNENKILWTKKVNRFDTRLQVGTQSNRVILSNSGDVALFDGTTGNEIKTISPARSVVDVDLLRNGEEIVITQSHTSITTSSGQPGFETKLLIVDGATGANRCEITVPNCSSELVVMKDGKRAFLAPTKCKRDPVSVIDLEGCTFEKNLPGFGPVSLSPDGNLVVAFIDNKAIDPQAPPLPADVLESDIQYHLMFIDSNTLSYTTLPIGSEIPRYAVTPNGQMLLVDSYHSTQRIRVLNIAEKSLKEVQGPMFQLNMYSLTPDSNWAFAVENNLYEIDIQKAVSKKVTLDFNPISLNMVPDGKTLLVKGTDAKVRLLDISSRKVVGEMGWK